MMPAQWQREWQAALRDPAALLEELQLDPDLLGPARQAADLFPLRVPRAYLARIRPGDPDDPLQNVTVEMYQYFIGLPAEDADLIFKGVADETADEIRKILEEEYYQDQDLDLDTIKSRIEDVTNVAENRVENIARTETTKLAVAARKNSYQKADPDNEFLYKHVGPSDGRTTDTCGRIKERTKDGVTWSQYVQILREESRKDFDDWSVSKHAPVAHYQCRHVPVRIVQ